MSALGQERTFSEQAPMSALPPKADIGTQSRNVRYVPIADIGLRHQMCERGSHDALVALNLAAVHHASCPGIERVATV